MNQQRMMYVSGRIFGACAAAALGVVSLLIPSRSSWAAEVNPGDYEQFPVGATIGAMYYQHASTNALYSNGNKASSDFNVRSDVGIARLLHVYKLSDTVTIDPQFLLPFGHVSGSGSAAVLGSASGVGDLILTAPIKVLLNAARDTLSANFYVYLPTGTYSNTSAFNLGENRWKLDFQTAYIKHFSPHWAVDLVGDAIWYGKNTQYGVNNATLKQDISYAAQIMLRYMPDATSSLAIGFGQQWGGSERVNGVDSNNAMRSTNMRLTAAKFITSQDQVLLQLGRDLAVQNGPAEDFRMNLRYVHIF